MRPIQATELAIRRFAAFLEKEPRGVGNFASAEREVKLLVGIADNIQEAAVQADDADGDKQALWLDELENLRRAQS